MPSARPSRRHDLLAQAIPRLRKSRELDDPARERARVERWHATLPSASERPLPSALVPWFGRRFSVVTEELDGYAVHTITPRHTTIAGTLLYVHGGGFMSTIDPMHVRFVCRLARHLGVRVVMPDYPLAPEHTWRDSFDSMLSLATRLGGDEGRLLLAGDSAGGGYALAPKAIISNLSKLQSQQTSNATSIVQKAAIAALAGSQQCVAEFRAEFIELRDHMLARLATIPGVTCTKPQGAFYVYPNISAYIGKGGIKSATELATRLLHEGHVVAVPGEAFGTAEHIRLSYPVTKETIDEGVKRLGNFLTSL